MFQRSDLTFVKPGMILCNNIAGSFDFLFLAVILNLLPFLQFSFLYEGFYVVVYGRLLLKKITSVFFLYKMFIPYLAKIFIKF